MRMPKLASRLARFLFGTKKRGALTILALCACLLGAFYWYIVSGGLVARQNAPYLEAAIANRLVNLSIPGEDKARKNPLSASSDSADVAAGRELYRKNCEVCHGYDGSGKTESGAWMYPRPADLRGADTVKRTDGALFYLIYNGIRNTGMPGWQLPDKQIWQLVAFIRNLPPVAAQEPLDYAAAYAKLAKSAHYVGSAACRQCHAEIYDRWKQTLMANVLRDPREHPDAIIPDLSQPDPLLTFSKDDIAFVYGGKWKQRYWKRVGDDYYPLPAQWDVTHKKWRPYFAKADWWSPYYPPDNLKRPTGPTCDGCHSVNYNIQTKTVTEWNVGCEKCHGPGSEHMKQPDGATIVNPARLDYVQANDTCIQCHSQGRPLTNPIAGQYYDWPVGYDVGENLSDFWELEEHKLGETTFTHYADGTAHKNRMQGNDYVNSLMYRHGVTCFTCHDAHGTQYNALLRKPADSLCLDCHGPRSPNGPHEATIEEHTHHKPDSAGSSCIDCHMPKIAKTIADVNVRSHTFCFVTPAKTAALQIPNACNVCHSDKTTAWAADVLKTWKDRSPWRMSE
jgi:predicted CXXCH cytochrome family protein